MRVCAYERGFVYLCVCVYISVCVCVQREIEVSSSVARNICKPKILNRTVHHLNSTIWSWKFHTVFFFFFHRKYLLMELVLVKF